MDELLAEIRQLKLRNDVLEAENKLFKLKISHKNATLETSSLLSDALPTVTNDNVKELETRIEELSTTNEKLKTELEESKQSLNKKNSDFEGQLSRMEIYKKESEERHRLLQENSEIQLKVTTLESIIDQLRISLRSKEQNTKDLIENTEGKEGTDAEIKERMNADLKETKMRLDESLQNVAKLERALANQSNELQLLQEQNLQTSQEMELLKQNQVKDDHVIIPKEDWIKISSLAEKESKTVAQLEILEADIASILEDKSIETQQFEEKISVCSNYECDYIFYFLSFLLIILTYMKSELQ